MSDVSFQFIYEKILCFIIIKKMAKVKNFNITKYKFFILFFCI